MNAANIIASFFGGFTLFYAYRFFRKYLSSSERYLSALSDPKTKELPIRTQQEIFTGHLAYAYAQLRWAILLFVLGVCQLIIAIQL